MKRLDLQSGLFLFALSLLMCVGSIRLSLGSLRDPGSGFLPFLAGMVLGVCSVFIFIESLRGTPSEANSFWESSSGRNKVALTLLSVVLYSLGLNVLGFIVMTGLLIGFLLVIIGNERWITVISGGVLSALASYTLFELLLRLRLPKGFLGI